MELMTLDFCLKTTYVSWISFKGGVYYAGTAEMA